MVAAVVAPAAGADARVRRGPLPVSERESERERTQERGGEEKLREGEDEAEYIFVWVDSDEKREKRES